MKRFRADFGYNINNEELWMQKFAKFETKLVKWEARDLTLKRKMLFINAYVVSSLNLMSVLYTDHVLKK